MLNGLDIEAFENACETLRDMDGFATISDLGIVSNGTQIDHLALETANDGGDKITFIAGDDPNDEDGEYEELELSVDDMNNVLTEFNNYF